MLCTHMKIELRKILSVLFLAAFILVLGSCEKSDLIEPDLEPVKFTKSSGGDDGDSDDDSANSGDITDDEDDQDSGEITDDEDDNDDSGSRSSNGQTLDKD